VNVDWMAKAACRGQPADVFFPDEEEHADYTQARLVCASCPVRDECLAFALKLNIGHGMYAGHTPHQRAVLRRRIHHEAA
jgi:WhiB family transcriptional regulator, redox-sensing transcriptional regulator